MNGPAYPGEGAVNEGIFKHKTIGRSYAARAKQRGKQRQRDPRRSRSKTQAQNNEETSVRQKRGNGGASGPSTRWEKG